MNIFDDKTKEMPGKTEWPVRVKMTPENPWELMHFNNEPPYDSIRHDVANVKRPRFGHGY